MKIPYNCLHTHGSVLFAARGGKIHTFSLPEGSHIATWKHPELDASIAGAQKKTVPEVIKETEKAAEGDDSVMADETEPPAKRQKVTEDGENGNENESKGTDKKGGKSKDKKPHKTAPVPDRPVIIQLTTTADGSHLVAVSGNDKAIWVFAHDGNGQLTQQSKRVMPKRPSSVTVSADSQILCADKFGDVYAIPLIKSSEPYIPPAKQSTANSSASTSSKTLPKQPAATVLTVHSKGNRAALAAQQRALEKGTNDTSKAESGGPDFEHTLLLGHVSMLTALRLAEDSQRRKYILTSDRDEHVRVSRYIPQAHVIHGFCLGHKDFVGDMVIPARRKHLLVSGGGDEELFVWDWFNGKLLSKANILSVVREVTPQATTVAMSKLLTVEYLSESGPETFILATCEGIPAIFSWRLQDNDSLTKANVIQLPGTPLDVATVTPGDSSTAIAVALHLSEESSTAAAQGLVVLDFTLADGRLTVDTTNTVNDEEQEAAEQDVSEADVRGLFYTVEHLRKQQASAAGEEEPQEDDASVAAE